MNGPGRPEARSLPAVLFPHRFEPFPGVESPSDIELAWDERRDWVLANLAHAAYRDPEWLAAELPRLGATSVQTFAHDGAAAFLARWPRRAALAFRGTEPHGPLRMSPDLRTAAEAVLGRVLHRTVELPAEYMDLLSSDVLADLRFLKRPLGTAHVHRGFLGELKKLWRPLITALRPLREDPEVSLLVTGHSLGGAMSTLTGMRVACDAVVTFGEPRVGAGIDAEWKGDPGAHLRYVNGLDPVPTLPPATWPFGYEHHGVEIRIEQPAGADLRYDHSIVDYADRLAAACRPG